MKKQFLAFFLILGLVPNSIFAHEENYFPKIFPVAEDGTVLYDEVFDPWGTEIFEPSYEIQQSSIHSNHYMNYNGKAVHYVKIEMQPNIHADIVFNYGVIESSNSLSNLVRQYNAFAGINGSFFSAYSGLPLPYGTIVNNGEVLHINGHPAFIGFTENNKFIMDIISSTIDWQIDGSPASGIWEINHSVSAEEAIMVFTDDYKSKIPVKSTGIAVVVNSDGVVNYHTSEGVYVPQNGKVFLFNSTEHQVLNRLGVGATTTLNVTLNGTYTDGTLLNQVTQGLTAGPSLIINGVVTNNPWSENFTETKITTGSAKRSFIGFTDDKEFTEIVIGTVSSATMNEMVQIVRSLGLNNAMCLDGGSSSGLYYNGKTLSSASRNVNNAIIFTEK
ncbi:MAG: hypothetical protein ATN36_08475 [Epulopiscium sp. Nele67-Bin005]|nr:MAG: hypothetical protein ATN36_08475 [Epulopiscium sp. Nele67-Bin005]